MRLLADQKTQGLWLRYWSEKCLMSTFFPGTLPWLLAPPQKPKGAPDVLQIERFEEMFHITSELVARFFCPSAIMSLICVVVVAFKSPLLHFPIIFRVVIQSSGQHRKLCLIAEPTRRLVTCKMQLSNYGIYTRCRDVSLGEEIQVFLES